MNHKATQWLIALLISTIVIFIRCTCRIQVINKPKKLEEGGYIIALWHGRLLMMPFLFRAKRQVYALISAHRDGRIIQKTGAFFGIKTITGSSSKGGATAVREMARKIKAQKNIFITPDGPKGPCCQAQGGAIELARITNAKILPVSINASKKWQVNSWDRFIIPKPFSTITIAWGEMIKVENKEERPLKQKQLEESLNELQDSIA